ncbi:MAG: hypothetical protein WKG07_18505 [Hymenobacter sp.]
MTDLKTGKSRQLAGQAAVYCYPIKASLPGPRATPCTTPMGKPGQFKADAALP